MGGQKSHLMIVMMVLVRDQVRLCKLKAYHADLTVVSLCMTADNRVTNDA